MAKSIRAISYIIVLTIGFGAGAWLAYDYAKNASVNNQLSQKLETQISDLEREVRQLNATIRELEDASEKKATDPGDLTFYSDLPREEVSPEPLETGKAVKIGSAITPATSPSHEAPSAQDASEMPQKDNLKSALDELTQAKDKKSEDTSVSEKHNNFSKDIPAASAMNSEIANEAIPATADKGRYRVQAGSFQHESDARGMQQKLKRHGVESTVKSAQVHGSTWYRVQIGPYVSMSDAKSAKAKLQKTVKGELLIVKSAH